MAFGQLRTDQSGNPYIQIKFQPHPPKDKKSGNLQIWLTGFLYDRTEQEKKDKDYPGNPRTKQQTDTS